MKITAVVVGYGDRGRRYSVYALKRPEELEIVGVVDPRRDQLEDAKKTFSLKDSQLFTSLDDLLKLGKIADCAIVTTMDQLHYVQGMALLQNNYNLLIEKPVTNSSKELEDLRRTAKERNLIMSVCHVLRYTPFYSSIKKAILAGKVGEIMNVEICEHVGVSHANASYVRGKWRSEAICGSGYLLAKCCHDLDLIAWLNNNTKPTQVVSFGDKSFMVKEKAPEGSTDRCYPNCPHLDTCQWSAKIQYIDNNIFDGYTFLTCEKKYADMTHEERIKALDTDPCGVCAYKNDSDLVDHQDVMIKFANGSTATHTLISGVPKAGRRIHVVGTDGEIEGWVGNSKFTIRKFDKSNCSYTEEIVDVSNMIEQNDGHAGGDHAIMEDFVAYLGGRERSISSTDISDSIVGHECVYAAEKSRKEGIIVNLDFSNL